MKKIFFAVAVSLVVFANAQNKMYRVISGHPIESEYATASFKTIELGNAAKTTPTSVEDLVRDVQSSLFNNTSFVPTDTTYSIAGKHYNFVQYINNIRVYGSSLKINTDLDGRITSVFNRTFEDNISPVEVQFPSDEVAFNFASNFPRMTTYTTEHVYLWNGTALVPGASVWVEYEEHKKMEFVIDHQMQALYSRDVNCYYHGGQNDSLVTALIFDPDPLTTAGSQYVAPYLDNNDQDSPALNGQRQTVTFKAGYNNGTYNLNGPIVSVQDFSTPSTPAFSSTSNNWTFTRSQNEFEDLMVYYHIDSYVRYLRSLGFTGFMNYAIPVDAHALQGSDNAMFSPDAGNVTGRLFFGEGGVDDAEDADVILHELGHAMSHFVSQSNVGTERRSLDEAISDYFAVSYSSTVSSFRATDVFTWDGHNQYWNGRMCTTTKCYDNITIAGNIYQHTDIICASLNDIANVIGRNEADEILLESMYSYSSNMTYKDAARLFVQADSLLNGGQNFTTIAGIFDNYCLYDAPIGVRELAQLNNIEVINSAGFSSNQNVTFVFGNSFDGAVSVTNAMGQMLKKESLNSALEWTLSPDGLSSGIYFVTFEFGSQIKTFKLIR